MNTAHLHLMLNHFPIAGVFFSLVLLALAWRKKDESLTRAALVLVVLTGVLTVPSFLSGDPAADLVQKLPNISKNAIEAHEEAAEKSAWAIWVTSAVALVALIQSGRKKVMAKWVLPLVAMLCLICGGLLAWSNNLGGQINHPEIRGN